MSYTYPYPDDDEVVSDEPAEDDEDDDPWSFQGRLQDCLDEVEADGSFSFFERYSMYANPCLRVKDLGPIGLPLTLRDAEALTRICKQSPFGKGQQTLVDESVRKTWELDATDFECENPAWALTLAQIRDAVMESLGVDVIVRAEKYKLLLYEEGAFFKAHRDSEKTTGMFGTLVICLPSAHKGGDVRLVHGKEERLLGTASNSAFNLSALAWYSDVQHEIQPIMSGYRLVLTYNLVHDTTNLKQSAAALDDRHARLEKLLQEWNQSDWLPSMFVYPLEHQYTDASLCLKNLKGQDAAKGRYLDSSCSKHGVNWFFSTLERTVHEDYGDEEDELSLDNLTTSDGGTIKLSLEVSKKDLLAEDFYDSREPDSEDEGEYTGNEGYNSTYRYHDTVIVLMRKDYDLSLQSTSGYRDVNSLATISKLIQDNRIGNKDSMLRYILDELVNGLSNVYEKYRYYMYAGDPGPELSDLFNTVAEHCRSTGQKSLVNDALHKAMKDSEWVTSTKLVRVIAKQMSTDITTNFDDAWNTWQVRPPHYRGALIGAR